MAKQQKKEKNIKEFVNEQHIKFYDNILEILAYILEKYSQELKEADFNFLEMSKNSIIVLEFLISSIGKVQKGQRLALGLDEKLFDDTLPQINIIEGLVEDKI